MARTKRLFTDHDRAALLAQIKGWRLACQAVQAHAPILGDVDRAVSGVTRAIDDLAGVLTGNREHFWTKQASIGEGPASQAAREAVDKAGGESG